MSEQLELLPQTNGAGIVPPAPPIDQFDPPIDPIPKPDKIIKAAETLMEALQFDDSGFQGKGGNGGLISRETIRKADALRIEISKYRRGIV